MSEFHDDRTAASDRVAINLSDAKLQKLQPDLYGPQSQSFKLPCGKTFLDAAATRRMLAEHLSFGDSRAALVVSEHPLLVAAYTDEQDTVFLLEFPQFLAEEYPLHIGYRLLTINTYARGQKLAPDITLGSKSLGRWINCYPIIADFLSTDDALIDRRKQAISPEEWQRTADMAKAQMSKRNYILRDGRPLRSMLPGRPMQIKRFFGIW